MNDAARISVIIPTRNRLLFLREAVASVQAQSFENWELIIVDDCSGDGTWGWLQSLNDKRIRVSRLEPHRGRSAARNAGSTAARGEYVLYLDDDDWLLEGALARLFDALRREPAAVGAVGAFVYKNDWGSWNRATHPRRRVVQSVWEDLFFGWVPLPGQTLLRKSAVIQAGGWNEIIPLCEDYELCLRLWRLGHAVLIPQPVLAYRIHPGQTATVGARQIGLTIRRRAVANAGTQERQRAGRSILADRLIQRAWRSFARGRPLEALCWWWQAVRRAPWLLKSPPCRVLIVEAGLRFLSRAVLSERSVRVLRKAKRAYIRAYRGELRRPSLGIPLAKAVRDAGDHS